MKFWILIRDVFRVLVTREHVGMSVDENIECSTALKGCFLLHVVLFRVEEYFCVFVLVKL